MYQQLPFLYLICICIRAIAHSASIVTSCCRQHHHADTLEEFKITDFQAADGTFQYKDLGWLSSYQDLEKEIAMPIGTTTAFTEGETMGDINYSVKLLNYISFTFFSATFEDTSSLLPFSMLPSSLVQ